MGLVWVEREKTFRTGEAVTALACVFNELHYSDGEPVEVEAWPIWHRPGKQWFIGDCGGALRHHVGPQGAVGIANGDYEKLYGVMTTGDFHLYQLVEPGRGGRPLARDLDEAAFTVAAASALLQRAKYQPFAIAIS